VLDNGVDKIKDFHFDTFISLNDIREFTDVSELSQKDLDKLERGSSFIIFDAS